MIRREASLEASFESQMRERLGDKSSRINQLEQDLEKERQRVAALEVRASTKLIDDEVRTAGVGARRGCGCSHSLWCLMRTPLTPLAHVSLCLNLRVREDGAKQHAEEGCRRPIRPGSRPQAQPRGTSEVGRRGGVSQSPRQQRQRTGTQACPSVRAAALCHVVVPVALTAAALLPCACACVSRASKQELVSLRAKLAESAPDTRMHELEARCQTLERQFRDAEATAIQLRGELQATRRGAQRDMEALGKQWERKCRDAAMEVAREVERRTADAWRQQAMTEKARLDGEVRKATRRADDFEKACVAAVGLACCCCCCCVGRVCLAPTVLTDTTELPAAGTVSARRSCWRTCERQKLALTFGRLRLAASLTGWLNSTVTC